MKSSQFRLGSEILIPKNAHKLKEKSKESHLSPEGCWLCGAICAGWTNEPVTRGKKSAATAPCVGNEPAGASDVSGCCGKVVGKWCESDENIWYIGYISFWWPLVFWGPQTNGHVKPVLWTAWDNHNDDNDNKNDNNQHSARDPSGPCRT